MEYTYRPEVPQEVSGPELEFIALHELVTNPALPVTLGFLGGIAVVTALEDAASNPS